jgi:branched-chain amino acid transport system permease protein
LDAELFAQLVLGGLSIAAVYVIIAMGINLVVGVSSIVNFAQGELLMIGMYMAYLFSRGCSCDPMLSLPLVLALSFAGGIGIQHLLINPVIGAGHKPQIILTLALSTLLISVVSFVFSPVYLPSVNTIYSSATLRAGPLSLPYTSALALAYTFVSAILVTFFLRRTNLGRAVRAVAQDADMALLFGIDVRRIYDFSFGVTFALAAGAGSVLVTYMYTFPTVGQPYLLFAFAAVTLGGLGSFGGAIVGGFILGIVQSFVLFYEPSLSTAAVFLVFLLVLLFRPSGLFGTKIRA